MATTVQRGTAGPPRRERVVEVTDVLAEYVFAFLTRATGEAHFERRGGRTYLVVE